MSSESVVKDIYDGTASFGRFMSVFSAVLMTIICSAFIYVGAKAALNKHVMLKTIAKIKASKCVVSSNVRSSAESIIRYSCNFSLEYNIDGIDYTTDVSNQYENQSYEVGDSINIYYYPGSPGSNIRTNAPLSKGLGMGLVVLSVFIIVLAWVWVVLARKFKVVAAAQGIRALI
jgi:hypothetical protein